VPIISVHPAIHLHSLLIYEELKRIVPAGPKLVLRHANLGRRRLRAFSAMSRSSKNPSNVYVATTWVVTSRDFSNDLFCVMSPVAG